MVRLAFILMLLSLPVLHAQEEFLAKQYFENGEFSKALSFYEKLVQTSPGRTDFSENLVKCYQQMEQYDKAIDYLKRRIQGRTLFPTAYIDLGYTFLLRDGEAAAIPWYEKALEIIEEHPNAGYGIAITFQRYTLLDYALRAFNRAMSLNPQLDYSIQIAQIYGEQGKIPEMFGAYLDVISRRPAIKGNVLRAMEPFISEDSQAENNLALKKILLTRAQQSPNPDWNELLSWLLVRQGQFAAAFIQEKAIYKRVPEMGLSRISELGYLAMQAGEWKIANQAYEYVISESFFDGEKLKAKLQQIAIMEQMQDTGLEDIRKAYLRLVETYSYTPENLPLFVAYANFLAFKDGQAESGISILKKALEMPLSDYTSGLLKIKLADILVFTGRFNEGLILYTQVQKALKNDVLAQEARFKVAQTSFYKGDFDWALTQLKVLRESSSQLIANDAMQLSLIISDNSLKDSTQTALKLFAKADLLAYQRKTGEALNTLEEILLQHKGEPIEDEALLRHGQLLSEQGDFTGALFSYQKIIEFFNQDILADDAHFAIAEIYRKHLDNKAAAMEHYQEILYRFQDSYYFPEARKKFRMLRGDSIN
jgi:tetratricopeptide (TPR) repeat protein